MAYDVSDDFEDARQHGIDPDKARRANRMFRRFMEAINEEFPAALNEGDPADRDIVMLGTAALLGEIAGLIWIASDEKLARKVLAAKYEFAIEKMESTAQRAPKA